MRSHPVAYTFQADIICDTCARDLAIAQALRLGAATVWGDAGTAEEALGEWASYAAVDRFDEASFDSSDFPKTVLNTMLDGFEHCGQCRDCIAHAPDDCGRLVDAQWRW